MSYAALLDKSLNQAFNLAKDLAVDITLTKKSGVTFDFATGDKVEGSTTDIITKAVFMQSKKESKEHNATKRQIMLKRKTVGDITSFDTILENGNTWSIGNPIKDDGYITIVEVNKEL